MIENKAELLAFWDGVTHIQEHLLREWTERIRSGERGKEVDGYATAVIHDFWLRHALEHEQSPVTLAWLADVLDKATEHRNPKELMSELGLLPRPRKRPPDPQRAIDVACWLRSAERLGYSANEAVELAAECFHKDVKTIDRYRRQAGAWADEMTVDAESLQHYFLAAKPPRPLPPPKDRK